MLDAARESVLGVGVRRTTLTDVARRAGVSRMTLYRRYPDVDSLFAALMVREFGTVIAAAVQAGARGTTGRERLVLEAVAAARGVREDPLFGKVLEVEPELLLPFVVDRMGANQHMALDRLTELVDAGHADGTIRAGDTKAQALAVLLVVQSFVLGGRVLGGVDPGRVLDELGGVLNGYLAPEPT